MPRATHTAPLSPGHAISPHALPQLRCNAASCGKSISPAAATCNGEGTVCRHSQDLTAKLGNAFPDIGRNLQLCLAPKASRLPGPLHFRARCTVPTARFPELLRSPGGTRFAPPMNLAHCLEGLPGILYPHTEHCAQVHAVHNARPPAARAAVVQRRGCIDEGGGIRPPLRHARRPEARRAGALLQKKRARTHTHTCAYCAMCTPAPAWASPQTCQEALPERRRAWTTQGVCCLGHSTRRHLAVHASRACLCQQVRWHASCVTPARHAWRMGGYTCMHT